MLNWLQSKVYVNDVRNVNDFIKSNRYLMFYTGFFMIFFFLPKILYQFHYISYISYIKSILH